MVRSDIEVTTARWPGLSPSAGPWGATDRRLLRTTPAPVTAGTSRTACSRSFHAIPSRPVTSKSSRALEALLEPATHSRPDAVG